MAQKETVYTESVIENMVAAYTAAESDEDRANTIVRLADDVGTSVASVRAKLVNLGVYKAKERTSKTGAPIESKAKIVGDIATLMGVEEEAIGSLEKATKRVLLAVRSYMRECSEADVSE
jgi:hypothetical protein